MLSFELGLRFFTTFRMAIILNRPLDCARGDSCVSSLLPAVLRINGGASNSIELCLRVYSIYLDGNGGILV